MTAIAPRLVAALMLSGAAIGLAACGSGYEDRGPPMIGSTTTTGGNGTVNGNPSGSYDGSNSATSAPR